MKILSYLSILVTPFILFAEAKEITITGNDTMQFDLKTFEVNAGDKVELTFKNIGKIPKIAMGHNLVVLKKGNFSNCFWTESNGCRSQCDQCTSRIGKR